MTDLLPCEIVQTDDNPTASVIWLHGLGADGHDFVPVVPQLNVSEDLAIRYVFPHAPVRPVTLNNGMAMRAWYDIISLDRNGRSDEAGIRASQAMIERLIAREIESGIPSHRIVIAGFSQGGAVALQTALRYEQPLAGVMALSTYLPLPNSLEGELTEVNKKTPIFMAHGTQDPVVAYDFGKNSYALMKEHQLNIQWHEYPMAHQVSMEQLVDIGSWLNKTLGE